MKKLIYILLLLPLLWSCAEEDSFTQGEEGGVCTVAFTVPGIEISATRADAAMPEGTKVTVYAYRVVGGTESTDCAQSRTYVCGADGSLTAVGQDMSLFVGATYKFYAVTPEYSYKSGTTKTFELGHSLTDHLKSSSVQATLTAEAQVLAFPVFKLEYAAVEVTVKLDPAATVLTSIVPVGEGLTLTGMTHTPYSYTLGDAGIDPSAQLTDGALNIPVDKMTTTTIEKLYEALGYLLPKKKADFRIALEFKANGTTLATFSTAIANMEFLAGKKYKFTIRFTDPKVYLTLDVVDWVEHSTTDGMGGGTAAGGNTLLIGEWNITSWNTGGMGGGSANTLKVGDWNGTSWGTGNMGGETGTTIGSGDWTNTDHNTGDTGGANTGNGLDTNDWTNTGHDTGNTGGTATGNNLGVNDWTNTGHDTGDIGGTATGNNLGINDWSTTNQNSEDVGDGTKNTLGVNNWTTTNQSSGDVGGTGM